jgi:hypothetical protein
MSYRSEIKSLYHPADSTAVAFERVQVSGLPSVCRLRGVIASQSSSASYTTTRIDFLLENDLVDDAVPDDDVVVFAGGTANWNPAQSIFIPDDSYIQLTDKLWYTNSSQNNIRSIHLTLFYTV